MRRVVVTGLGLITPLGNDVATTWDALIAGRSGLGLVTRFDTSAYEHPIAAEVKGFNPAEVVDPKIARRIDLSSAFALAASHQALADAGIDMAAEDASRVGVLLGTGMGSAHLIVEGQQILNEKGHRRVSPFMVSHMLPDTATGLVAIALGARGPNFAITVRHAESPDLGRVRKRLEAQPELLSLGPQAVLYAVFDEVVDEYQPVISGLENDIDEIEDQLFSGDSAVSRRIYELARETMAFKRATQPLVGMLASLEAGFEKYGVHVELQRNLRDVLDHTIKTVERADSFRALLQNALTVQATLVTQGQNDEMRRLSSTSLEQGEQVKKISSWAAILFAPTLVAAIYGMNFEFMPELGQPWGYPFALGLMLVSAVGLYAVFKRRGWL